MDEQQWTLNTGEYSFNSFNIAWAHSDESSKNEFGVTGVLSHGIQDPNYDICVGVWSVPLITL